MTDRHAPAGPVQTRRRPRVFLGLAEIAGYYGQLQKGLLDLGVQCTFATLLEHPFEYSRAREHPAVRVARHASGRRLGSTALPKLYWTAVDVLARIWLLLWALPRHDAFIFGYRSSFFRFAELPLLRLLRKKIIYVFHGSDSRPVYLDGAIMARATVPDVAERIRLVEQQKAAVATIERYADVVISYPLHSHLHSRPFVFTTLVGFPFEYRIDAASVGVRSGAVRVLHAPSQQASKGTAVILRAIAELQAEGHDLELVQIAGRPHAEVMQEIAACDFVVDQAYSDAPCSGIAAEAAFCGKPVIIGGYAWEAIQQAYAPDAIPPVHYCRPEEIKEAIRTLASDEQYRSELGERARIFFETHWGPRKVAERYLRLIEGDIPAEWLCDPERVHYLYGYGLDVDSLRRSIRSILDAAGPAALQLPDKPELARKLVQFAQS